MIVFPAFLNLSINFSIRSWWLEMQSALGLPLPPPTNCVELLHLCKLQRIYSMLFKYRFFGDVHVWNHLLCCWKWAFAMTSVFSLQNSISLCPALFCTPRPSLSVIPGIAWLLTFSFQPAMMKKTSFLTVSIAERNVYGVWVLAA